MGAEREFNDKKLKLSQMRTYKLIIPEIYDRC